MKFLVDTNAGRLARWLRLLGYDTDFYPRGADTELVRRARAEDRIVLTRDRGVVATKSIASLFLVSDDWRTQLQQVVSAYGLVEGEPRCMKCNTPIEDRSREEALPYVPESVAAQHDQFALNLLPSPAGPPPGEPAPG